ncbi:MAG: hypothetical protein JW969_12720 [Spirochaetales bacterium]|nr:hypothetical protein [Spirochaetales bacterium]
MQKNLNSLLKKSIDLWAETAPAEELKDNYRKWRLFPVFDALYFIRTSQKIRNEISLIKNSKDKFSLDDLYFKSPIPQDYNFEITKCPPADYALHHDFIDIVTGTFRYYFETKSSLHAIDLGLRIARQSFDTYKTLSDSWIPVLKATHQFLLNQLNSREAYDGDGCFAAFVDRRYTIFGTYTAVSAYSIFNYLQSELSSKFDLSSIEFPYKSVLLRLLSQDFQYETEKIFAYKPYDSKYPCLSTTSYVFSILEILSNIRNTLASSGHFNVEFDSLNNDLKIKVKKMDEYLHQCWDEKNGGFLSRPKEDDEKKETLPYNIAHTRAAMQIFRYFLSHGYYDSIPSWFKLDKTMEFIISCWKTKIYYPGFVNSPVDVASSLCSDRAVAGCLKLNIIFELSGFISKDNITNPKRYVELNNILYRLLEESGDYIYRLFVDNSQQLSYAYPVNMIFSDSILVKLFYFIRSTFDIIIHSIIHPSIPIEIERKTGKVIPLK